MKSAFFSMLALPALFIGAIAAPTASPEMDVVEKRQVADAYSIVETLYADIQVYTGAINSTAESLTSESTAAQNATAAKAFRTNVKAITKAVKEATTKVDALSSSSKLVRRQTGAALASLVEDLLLDISGALNNIIATLGLTSLLSSLTPLVGSLSALLLSLEVVVNNLLALVQQLLDGLLTGLSVGLAGLTL